MAGAYIPHNGGGPPRLGDAIEKALKIVGITEERVTKLLGRPCGCAKRKAVFNAISAWAYRVLGGKTEDAAKHFEELTEEGKP